MASLKERILAKCEVQGDCLVWKGRLVRGRPSIVNVKDNKTTNIDIQRSLAIKKFALDDSKVISIKTSCGNPRCISKAHLEVVERVRQPNQVLTRKDRAGNQMTHNKRVFELSVLYGADVISLETGFSTGFVNYLRKHNTAMLPYFQLKLEQHVGMTLSEIRSGDVDKIVAEYKLSTFAQNYIKSMQNFPIHDPDLYSALLDQCVVTKDHLVWVGDRSKNGTPIYKALGNQSRKAQGVFMYATFGLDIDREYQVKCGFKDCVNPYHCEVVENEEIFAEV